MGCHTWFKIPYTNFNLEDARIKLKEHFEKKLLNNTPDKLDEEIRESFLQDNPDYFEYLDLYFKEKLSSLDAMSENEIKYLYCDTFNDELERTLTLEDDGEIYADLSGSNLTPESEWFHDCFRKYGYPDTVLRSYEQTMDYINHPLTECETFPRTNERIAEFWKKHPKGLILFG